MPNPGGWTQLLCPDFRYSFKTLFQASLRGCRRVNIAYKFALCFQYFLMAIPNKQIKAQFGNHFKLILKNSRVKNMTKNVQTKNFCILKRNVRPKCNRKKNVRPKCKLEENVRPKSKRKKNVRPKCKRTFKRNQFQQLSKKGFKKGVHFRGVAFAQKSSKIGTQKMKNRYIYIYFLYIYIYIYYIYRYIYIYVMEIWIFSFYKGIHLAPY